MAAGTSAPTPSSPTPGGSRPPSSGRFVEYDRYIESQLRRTRRQVKGIDLTAALMSLAAGSMLFFLAAALADHWLIPGGMGFTGRLICLLLYCVGALAFVCLKLAPLVLRRINPVYAAQTIERNRPGLKNSLVNFLLLRSGGEELPQRVYEAIEEQAATKLSAEHVETAVDRTPVIKLLTVLMVLVSVVALYRILSPKNPFTSFRRVIDPWADISAPTRVAISDVEPGDNDGYHDQHFNVTALISGLAAGESPLVHYSTSDGQVVDHHVRMTLPESGYRYTAELPADAAGLQQDLAYWITAGDAISPHYQIKVHTAPSIVVDSLEYKYPSYSEIAARSVPKHGNIHALEGTQVTIRATASHEIRSADLDFECDGRRDLPMKIDGRKASVTFRLALKEGTDQPEHESYQLRFTNLEGHENPKPIRYTIEVIRDLPPELAIVEPELKATEEFNLAAGASMPLVLTASDPDYKLDAVQLHARRGNEKLLDEPLLAEPRSGPFRRRFLFATRDLKLKPGETITLWAAADDNRQPKPNHVETPHYTVRITSPDGRQEPDQLADAKSNKQPGAEKPQNDGGGDKPERAPRRPGEQMQPNDQQQPGEPPGDGEKEQEQNPQKADRRNERSSRQQESGGKEQADKDEGQEERSQDKSQADKAAGQKSAEERSGQDEESSADQKSGGDKSSRGQQQGADGEGDQGKDAQQAPGGKGKSDRVDPEKDAGRAIDEINDFFNKKQQEKSQKDQPQPGKEQPEKQRPDKPQQQPDQKEKGGDRGEQSDKKQGADQQDQTSADQKQQGGGKAKSQGQQGQQGDEQQTGAGGEKKPSPGQKSGNEKAGQQQGDSQKKGDGQKQESGEKAGSSGPQKGQEPSRGAEKMSVGNESPQQEQPGSPTGGEEQGKQSKEGKGSEKGAEPGEKTAAKSQQGGDQAGQPNGEPAQKDGDHGAEGQGTEKNSGDKKGADKNGTDKGIEQGSPGEKMSQEKAGSQDRKGAEQNPSGEQNQSDNEKQPGPGEASGGEPSEEQQKTADGQNSGGGKAGQGDDKNKTPQQSGGSGNSGQEKQMKEGEKGEGTEAAKVGDQDPKDARGDKRPQPGKGGQTKGQGEPDKNSNGDQKDPNQDVDGGDPEGQDRGKGGAGKPGGNKDPVASPKGTNKQKDKQQTSDEKGRANTDEEGNSGSESDQQSDSKSDKSGDLSGGGGQGGGQRAKSPGKGSAGQTSDAEQGGGESEQTGKGPTGDKGGDQVKGDRRSGGASSGEKGTGSTKQQGGSKPGKGQGANAQPGEQNGQNQNGQEMNGQDQEGQRPPQQSSDGKSNGKQQASQPADQPGEESSQESPGGRPTPSDKGGHDLQGNNAGSNRSNPTGGGIPGTDSPEPPAAPSDMSEPGGEDPDLEYTRKATDLALNRLKDQLDKGQPDPELLEKLKWSRQDVEGFVRRWEQLKKAAKTPGPQGDAAREQLDETLRSLGLQPHGTTLSGGQKRDDQRRNLIESRRTAPPPEYAEQYREFSKGLSKGRK